MNSFTPRCLRRASWASDVVAMYLHRGAFELALADEDQEQESDRWCSHTPCGQEFGESREALVIRREMTRRISRGGIAGDPQTPDGGIRRSRSRADRRVRHGSFIQSVPRNAWNASPRAKQLSASGRSRTLSKTRPGSVCAAWHGSARPRRRDDDDGDRAQPPMQAFGSVE